MQYSINQLAVPPVPQAYPSPRETYAASGLKNTLHGNVFQLKLLMLFLYRASQTQYQFRLATEMNEAGKFDDLVYEQNLWNTRQFCFLQAKHKQDETELLTFNQIVDSNDHDFALQKYFITYLSLKEKVPIKNLFICTNIGPSPELQEKLHLDIEQNIFFDTLTPTNPFRYKFKTTFSDRHRVIESLRECSELDLLARVLAASINKNKFIKRTSDILKKYLDILATEVIDKKFKQFKPAFIQGCPLSPTALAFRNTLSKYLDLSRYAHVTIQVPDNFGTQVITPGLPTDLIRDEDINDFLDRLVLVLKCPNEVKLGEIIQRNLSINFNLIDSQFLFGHFEKWMLDWMKAKQGVFLSQEDARKFFQETNEKLAQLAMVGPTDEYQQSINQHGIHFRNTFNISSLLNSYKTLGITTDHPLWLTSIKVYAELAQAFPLKGTYILMRLSSALLLQERLIQAFQANTCKLLVIECDTNLSSATILFSQLASIIYNTTGKNIILIHKTSQNFSEINLPNKFLIIDGHNNFMDLTPESQEKLRDSTIYFQGIEQKLHQILPSHETDFFAEPEVMQEIYTTEILTAGTPVLGLSEFDNFCYIDRIFTRQVQINIECLRENNHDIFIIYNFSEFKEKSHLIPADQQWHTVDQIKSHSTGIFPRYFFFPQELNRHTINLFKEHYPQHNLHFLCWEENTLTWQQSFGNLGGLRSYLYENIDEIKQDDLMDTNRLSIIAADPGMGKTSITIQIPARIKEKHPNNWVIRVALKNNEPLIQRQNLVNLQDVIQFLAQLEGKNAVTAKLLDIYLKIPKKVYIFLDGLDEIDPENSEKITTLIHILHQETDAQITISSRLNLRQQLEDKFSLFSYNLKPFSHSDRKNYLAKFWSRVLNIDKDDLRLNIYIDAVLKNFSAATADTQLEFMGIPLQAKMLAEALIEDVHQFYFSAQTEPVLPDKLDIICLYQKFIQNKYEIYFKDKRGLTLSADIKTTLENNITKAHRYVAMAYLFPEHAKSLSNMLDFDLKASELSQVGIIQYHQGTISFIHRTFSEYFVADFLLHWLSKNESDSKYKFAHNFLLENIFKYKNKVIIGFIEQRIAKLTPENTLYKKWNNIITARLLQSDSIKKERLYYKNYTRNLPVTLNFSFEQAKQELETLKDKLYYKSTWNEDKSKIDTFLFSLFNHLLKCTDINTLTHFLTQLAETANKARIDLIRARIFENIDGFLTYYFPIAFSSSQLDLTAIRAALDKLHSTTLLTNSFSEAIAKRKNFIEKKYIYSFIIDHRGTYGIQEIYTDPNFIFMLLCRTQPFSREELNYLISCYPKHQQNANYVQLFLNINETDLTFVTNFLINNQLWYPLIRLHQKFPTIDLRPYTAAIYANRELYWLERAGIDLVVEFKILTKEMASVFCRILTRSPVDGWVTGYASNISNRIPQLLDYMQTSQTHSIDTLALYSMVTTFVRFAAQHNTSLNLNSQQLKTVFNLIEHALNTSILTYTHLDMAINNLVTITQVYQLEMVVVEESILIFDPADDFTYYLTSTSLPQLIPLIRAQQETDTQKFTTAYKDMVKDQVLAKKPSEERLTRRHSLH